MKTTEYQHLNDATYTAIYSYANGRHGHGSVDEMVGQMDDLFDLAMTIIKANK